MLQKEIKERKLILVISILKVRHFSFDKILIYYNIPCQFAKYL